MGLSSLRKKIPFSMKLFLLDAYALIYRAHFAFIKRPMLNSKGVNVSAVYGFVSGLWDLLQKERPTHIAVAFDLSGPTFRHEMFTAYKANRDEQPEDITVAVPYIREILRGFDIPILEMPGYEADDVIGTLAKQAEAQGFTVYMMTPDKDYAQLVSEHIFLYKPARMGNDIQIWGVPEVLADWGIQRVEQVVDCLGLQGDSIDNIPGVPGIGPKNAQSLLAKYGSIEGILAHLDELAGKQQEALRKYADQALLSKKLAAIDLNVPVTFDAQACHMGEWHRDQLAAVFRELEFRSLTARILGPSTAEPAEPRPGAQGDLFGAAVAAPAPTAPSKAALGEKNLSNTPHEYRLADTPEAQQALLEQLLAVEAACFDTETTGIDPTEAELVGLSFAVRPHEAWYVPIPEDPAEARRALAFFRPFFENGNIGKIGQNLKYDVIVLRFHGVEVKGDFYDTMIAHYLLEPDRRHNMDYLAETYLDYSPVPIESLIGKKGKNQLSMREVPLRKLADYAAEDADVTLQLREVLFPQMTGPVRKLYDEVEAPVIRVLADIESEGVRIDPDFLQDYSLVLEKEILALQEKIHAQAGVRELNLNAPGQIGDLLFVRMKIPYRWKKTKTGQFSTDEEILSELAAEHGIVRDILDYRGLAKLKSTYVDALPRMINPRTGRIHTSFNQALAQTGRLSSQNPNLQNIPVRTERGREIRKAFIPRDTGHVLLSADYSQIELRLVAHISGDETLLEAFRQGHDIHTATAAKVFGVTLDEVTKDQRYKAKTVNFSILYGAGAHNLSKQLGIRRGEAQQIIEAYFAQFTGLKAYMEGTVAEAREKGYVTTLLGRRRYLRDIHSASAVTRANEERVAINTPVQGSAADMIKVAMIHINEALRSGGFGARMILQVHDELVFDVPRHEVDRLRPIIEQHMKNALPGLKVPIEVGIGTGENWLEAH
jgi:DNA polymerase-1